MAATPPARVSQLASEAITPGPARPAMVSQDVVEVLLPYAAAPPATTGDAVALDGTSGEITTPYTEPLLTAFTAMIWVKPPAAFVQQYPRIFDSGQVYSAAGWGFGYNLDSSSNRFEAAVNTGTVTYAVDSDPLADLEGAWHLWLWTYDGTNLTLYRDGVQVAQSAKSGAIAAPAQAVMIGTDGAGAVTFANGTFAHATFWSGTVLTALEITDLCSNAQGTTEADYEAYVEGLSPTLYYPLQETTGTTAANGGSTGSGDDGTYGGGYTQGEVGPVTSQGPDAFVTQDVVEVLLQAGPAQPAFVSQDVVEVVAVPGYEPPSGGPTPSSFGYAG